jgi:hypothetical protein
MTHDTTPRPVGVPDRVPAPARVWPGRVARVVSGLAVLGLVGGAVVAATRLPARDDAAVPATRVAVPAATTSLVCPGTLVLPDDTGRGDSAFNPVPVAPDTRVSALTAGTTDGPGAIRPLTQASSLAKLPAGGAAAMVDDVTKPLVVAADPGDDRAARLAGATGTFVTAGDLRGLAAASCQEPTADAWLVGGSTELSSTAHLVLVNAGSTPAQVTVQVWGPNGLADLSTDQYLVAPRAQKVLHLAALAPEQRRVAVHLTATGGRVAAYVQDSSLSGFTPTGTDLVVAGTQPATEQVVPGVSVTSSDVDDAVVPAVRLLVPGTRAAKATITLLGPDGASVLPGGDAVGLTAGSVTDVSLGGLAAGVYTLVVRADQPVLASAVVTRRGGAAPQGGGTMVDRAWAAATTAGRSGVVAVPQGTTGSLVLSGVAARGVTGDATGTLRILGEHGKVLATRPVRISAGSTGAWTLGGLVGDDETLAVAPPADDAGDAGDGGDGDDAGDDAAPSGDATPELPANLGGAQTWFAPDPAPTKPVTTTGGPTVTGVDLVTDGGARVRLAWAVVATVDRPDGQLVSVLDPVAVASGTPDVALQRDSRAGIR